MNTDFKYYPSSLPRALQSGYVTRHKPNILRTQMADGYTRQRLINQGAPDIVNVNICLNEIQYRTFLQWYKADIHSGQDWFIMPLLSTEGDQSIQWKYVRIQGGEISANLVTTNETTGSIYKLSMVLDVSNTIVDDGSWDPDIPTGATDDETGDLVVIPDSQIISDADDLGDSSGTYTIVEE